MKKKVISFVTTFILVFALTNINVMAADFNLSVTPNTTGTSYSVGYKIYDVDGNLRETGAIPISEEAASLEPSPTYDNYPPRTLINGELMTLDLPGTGVFIVDKNSNITMSFGLNRNANIFAGIYETPSGT